MADEKKGGSAKELLVKHGEKIGLGIAVLMLLGYVLLFYLPDKANPDQAKLRQSVRNLETRMQTPRTEHEPPPAKAWEQGAVGPWNRAIAAAKGADDWAASLVTAVSESTKERLKVRPPQAVAPSIEFDNLEVNLDSVVLSWSVREFTAQEKVKMGRETPKRIPVDLTSFKIERDVNGKGKWEEVATLDDPKARSWKDVKIEPKTKYAYRISAFSDKKEFVDNGGEESGPNPTGLAGLVSSPVAQTLGIWKISFANASRPASADRGMVYVTIEKFEKALGAKVERKQIHRDGDRIGWKEGEGAEASSKHRVQVGNKSVEVDFNTGITLVSVKPRRVTVQITKCKRKFGPGGVPEYPCDKIKETRSFDVHEITLNGPEGRQVIQSPNPKEHPNGQDQICEECGGRKPVTRESLEPKEEAPKEDPAVTAAKKKEADAEALFAEAEKLFKAGKTKEAAPKYERLLKDFAGTDFVSKGQRPLIEQRLAESR